METLNVYGDNNSAGEKNYGATSFLLQNNPDHNADPTYSQLPQIVTDGVNDYYHIIMDDNSAGGMMLEYYIQLGFASNYKGVQGAITFEPTQKWNANYASHLPAATGYWASASGGDGTIILTSTNPRRPLEGGNSDYPLQAPAGKDDGNGSGNPNMVIIRQDLVTGDLTQKFLKSNFANKATITQTVTGADGAGKTMTSYTKIDMSATTYSQNSYSLSTSGTIREFENTTIFTGPDVAFLNSAASFDYEKDAQAGHSSVTGGQYTYTEGSGPGGSNGTYAYTSGNFDLQSVNWADYFDANLANPWGCEFLYAANTAWGCPAKPRY